MSIVLKMTRMEHNQKYLLTSFWKIRNNCSVNLLEWRVKCGFFGWFNFKRFFFTYIFFLSHALPWPTNSPTCEYKFTQNRWVKTLGNGQSISQSTIEVSKQWNKWKNFKVRFKNFYCKKIKICVGFAKLVLRNRFCLLCI